MRKNEMQANEIPPRLVGPRPRLTRLHCFAWICYLFLTSSAGLLAQNSSVPPATPAAPKTTPAASTNPPSTPPSAPASPPEARFRIAPGLAASLFASEPLLANPTSISFDDHGRLYVVETHRRRTSAFDIRRATNWLDADLSFRSVADRSNFLAKVLVPENDKIPPAIKIDHNKDGKFDFQDLTVESERIRLLEDRNNDGRADHSSLFADGFNTSVSGVAAGILARGSNVWFTCIPDLWMLQDTNRDGQADLRRALLHGFGVHWSFGGHDLHGLCMGPDGKLYFTVGDRGLNVESASGKVAYPDSGAVMRCNPDGSEFELVATGLRNPQELAFDQFGNLWTGDNNGDAGDKARWVYVVEGSDSGWHIGWQHLPNLGPWNDEKLWELHPTNTAAYVLPPVAHIGHGPAGIAFYPGTGLPAHYANHFFMCDFPGGVRSFSLQPEGAGYRAVNASEVLWNLFPVDVAFSPDGGLFVADWIEGWEKTGKGRIYRLTHSDLAKDPDVRETKKLLGEGMARRSARELARLLEHKDMRVRQEAQFSLVSQGATNQLLRAALKNDNPLARLHAIWGLGQITRTNAIATPALLPLLQDPDPEVRAQTAKVLGNPRFPWAFEALIPLLQDPEPRVQFFAAMAIGKLGRQDATEPIFQMLAANENRDPFLRHACVMALVWMKDLNALISAAKDPSEFIRLGSLLALRRLERPEIAMFLYDIQPALVLEAARSIHDLPIESALSQLASLITKTNLAEPVMRRVINANFRAGKLENALALSGYAVRSSAPEPLRAEALKRLSHWATPPPLDPILGLWRPLPSRDSRSVTIVLRSDLPHLLTNAPPLVQLAAIQTAVSLKFNQANPILFSLIAQKTAAPNVRTEALQALAQLQDPRFPEAVQLALADPNELVRQSAARFQSILKPESALSLAAKVLEHGSVRDQQNALQTIATTQDSAADNVVAAWLDNLKAGQIPPELELDLLEAARQRKSNVVQSKLAEYISSRPQNDPIAQFREVLFGGDPVAGRKIFFDRADVACVRCHKMDGTGGEVGPNLSAIGTAKSRVYLLESLLAPNQHIAQGYETAVITLKSGTTYAGIVKNETAQDLVLLSPEDGLISLGKNQIANRDRGPSAMPGEVESILTRRELRDLLEFLAAAKGSKQ